jgi:hypothetical protein
MTKPGVRDRQENELKEDFLEKRGFTWGALVVLLVLTLIAALVLPISLRCTTFLHIE